MEQYAEVVQDLEGNAVPDASVQVVTPGGAPASIFDKNGNPIAGNTVTTGALGDFAFQVPNGKYVLRVVVRGTVYKTIGPLTFYDPDDDTTERVTAAQVEAQVTESVGEVNTALAAPNGGTRIGFRETTVDQRLRTAVNIQDFGGRDDFGAGNTDNAPAYADITSQFPAGTIIKFPKVATGRYDFISYAGGDYNNYVWDVDEGVILRFPINAVMGQPLLRVVRDTVCYFKDLNTYYTLKSSFSNTLQARFHLYKDQFFGPGDRDTTTISPVDLAGLSVEKFDSAWPDGPLTVSSSITTVARKASISLAAGNAGFKGVALPAFPGAEYSFSYETPAGWDGFYMFGVLTQNGFDLMYESTVPGTGASRMQKEFGSPSLNSTVKFRGSGNHLSTWAKNGYCTVRCLSANSFEVLVNGVKRFRAWSTASPLRSVFLGAGFGTAASTIGVRDVTLARSKPTAGQKPLKMMSIGDSITDGQIHGNWPNYMASALEGTMGIRVSRMINIAVSGAKAEEQYTTLLSADITDIDVAVILIGVNDIQAQTDPDAAFIFNLGRILDRFNTIGIPCVVGVPTMFYSRALAAGSSGTTVQGVDSSNYEKGAGYRSRLVYEVANRNPTLNRICFGTLEDLGPVLSDWLVDTEGLDAIVSDNIHPTSHARRLIGYAMARSVAGLLAPQLSRSYPVTGFQPSWMRNGCTASLAGFEISADGMAHLTEYFNVGATVADGTLVFEVPPFLWPSATVQVPCLVVGAAYSALVRLLLDTTGKATIYGLPAGATGVYLNTAIYKLKW